MTSADETVLATVVDGVATVTLNRPERRNGVTWPMIDRAIRVLTDLAEDRAVRALVLTGAGGAFCSGMDLAERIVPDELPFMRRVGLLCTLLHDLPVPTVAKVAGPAMGFGSNLAFCCDLVVAGESAVFGEIFAERGLGLDGGGSWSLPRLIGPAKAKELAFFAARVSGAEAAELGLVNRVVPDDKLDATVDDWAERLAAGPRRALSMMKAAINASYERSFADAIEAEALGQSIGLRSPEAKEGMKAFLEKRPPDFRSC